MAKTPRFAANLADQGRFPLPGSLKSALAPETATPPLRSSGSPAARIHATPMPPPPGTPAMGSFSVSVFVPAKKPIVVAPLGKPAVRLSREDFARRHGPKPASLRLIQRFAAEYGLTYATPAPGRRAVQLTGPAANMERAFGVTLTLQSIHGQNFRVRSGVITLPSQLKPHVEAVLGLDNRPLAQRRTARPAAAPAAASAGTTGGLTPMRVAEYYNVPAGASAAGQTIAILEFAGGFTDDIHAYFTNLNLPIPDLVSFSVDQATNAPEGNSSDNDKEVCMDIQIASAAAPGARIVVYFAPNTEKGFEEAISAAIGDGTNNPSVISMSWGAAESFWTPGGLDQVNKACQTAIPHGVTIVVATGDSGSNGGGADNTNNVYFPASSPFVLACGGTSFAAAAFVDEQAWQSSGGGVSSAFALPAWQTTVPPVPASPTPTGGRGTPDVSAFADPSPGYAIRVDGKDLTDGGTSAATPLWAALIALSNAINGNRAGFVNPTLYAANPSPFTDILLGTNEGFDAGAGWDACTGLGVPNAPAIIEALKHL